jgi:hypothetical protein
VNLLTDVNAFFTEHMRCGDLDAGVDGAIGWITCECGARMARRTDEAGGPPENRRFSP